MKKALVDFFIAYGAEEVLECMRTLWPEARSKLHAFHFPSLLKRLVAKKEEKGTKKESGQQQLF